MNGIKPAGTQLTLLKSPTASSSNTSKAPADAAVRSNTSATVLSLTSHSREAGSKDRAVRNYDEAKELADRIAANLKGDEHKLDGPHSVKGVFTIN